MEKSFNKNKPIYIDHLDEDDPIPRQRYVCFSFITPSRVKGAKDNLVKVRGVYETLDEANARCAEISEKDNLFDVFIGEVGKWSIITNDPAKAQDVVYQEDEMQKLAKGYKDNLTEAKNMEKQRKLDLLKEGKYEKSGNASSKRSETAQRLKKLYEDKKNKKSLLEEAKNKLKSSDTNTVYSEQKLKRQQLENDWKNKEKEVNDKKALSKEEEKRLNDTKSLLDDKEQEVKSVDKNIKKIKKLYEKLKQAEENTK